MRVMSVPVSREQLREAVDHHGPVAYLLTVAVDGRPHAVSTPVTWVGERVAVEGGARTRANARERPLVSLLWPPVEAGGYSLIVDGDAAEVGGALVVTPTKAVLHRSAGAPDPAASACGSDCIPLVDPA